MWWFDNINLRMCFVVVYTSTVNGYSLNMYFLNESGMLMHFLLFVLPYQISPPLHPWASIGPLVTGIWLECPTSVAMQGALRIIWLYWPTTHRLTVKYMSKKRKLVNVTTIVSYHIISYHIIRPLISNPVISYNPTISYHTTPYHIISYHIISYHIISYHIIYHHPISLEYSFGSLMVLIFNISNSECPFLTPSHRITKSQRANNHPGWIK